MRLQQYSILQISARTLLSCAGKTAQGYRFYFDTTAISNQHAITHTIQADCGMYRQLMLALHGTAQYHLNPVAEDLKEVLLYLDFSGVFDRRAIGRVKQLQELAEWLFRPEGILVDFGKGAVRFVAFERSASMSRENKLSFLRADLYDTMWERMTLGMDLRSCQLSKLYAYNGLLFSDGRRIENFSLDADHIVVVDNPRSILKNVSVVTVEDDGSDQPMRRYSRVEKTADVEVLEFDGEGLISRRLGEQLNPYNEKGGHYSFQIRLPYIKGVVHAVDFASLFTELGVTEIVDIDGNRHRASQVDMILTKSMCKGWGWMKENGLSWQEYLTRCRAYGHTLFVTGMDRRSRDGLTELNYQLLNTAAITAEEYRPSSLPFGWETSPEASNQGWLTKSTETAYYNAIANPAWQISYFEADRDNPELEITNKRRVRAELLHRNPAFLNERIFQKELEDQAKSIRAKFGLGKLLVSGDTRYLSDDLMRLLAVIARPASEVAYHTLMKEALSGAVIYTPQPSFPTQPQLTILRNPHISRNEEVLATPLAAAGPLRGKYLYHLYYVAMVDSRSLIADRLGGADYDGDTVHIYAEPMLNACIRRNYQGGLENENNLPLLKIPAAKPFMADAQDWQARFETVKSTFSSRVGQISNAALRRSIQAYDESLPAAQREEYRKQTEILTILTGLEIDSAKTGIKPDLSEYLGNQKQVKSAFLRYKEIAGDPDDHAWYEDSKAARMKAFFDATDWTRITANLERTPWYAHQLGIQTRRQRAVPADSAEIFTFAANPPWRDELDPDILERMRSIIADYETAKRRCEALRHIKPSADCKKDILRILFSRNQEDEYSVERLFRAFDRYPPRLIRDALARLRESDWQFTPPEERHVMLYEIFRPSPPYDLVDFLCDFRCGGYRILGDILEDLEDQYTKQAAVNRKGIQDNDSPQMRRMMQGAAGDPDYETVLIRNCVNVMRPIDAREAANRIPWEDAVKCAEMLGKRQFILEVLPTVALDLAIDRTKPQQKEKKKGWWKFWLTK